MDFAYKAIAIALPFVMGALTAFIARRKGRNVAGWFVLGLIFQLLALPVVLLLPSLKQTLGEPVVSDSRVLAFLGKVFGGVFLGFMVIFAANGGAGGSSKMSTAAWIALVIYLAFFIPAVVLWAKQAYKPNA
jgi:hypothetical protein